MERKRIQERNRDAQPEVLAPAEAFDDWSPDEQFRRKWHPRHDPTQVGPASRAVNRRLRSSTAGWVERPTSKEFYDAVRAKEPTSRQAAIVHTWLQEADREDMIEAWAEGAYTWRGLAQAIHRAGLERTPRCSDINGLAV